MPFYEYHCAANGRTVEVRHGMSERLSTWGQLAEKAAIEPGETPSDARVERLLSTPVPLTGQGGDPGFQGCGSGCGCVPQA